MPGLLKNLVTRVRYRFSRYGNPEPPLLEEVKRADREFAAQRYADAEAIYLSILKFHPRHQRAQTNLAIVWSATGRVTEALALLHDTVEAHPDFFDAWFNLAVIEHARGELDSAVKAYEKAREIDPSSAETRRNLGMLNLLRGELTEPNWRDFGWRRLCPGFETTAFPCDAPLWRGEESKAVSIAVHGEQGLGDEIQYASCYPRLIASTGKTLIACNDRLETLFRRSFPAAEVFGLSLCSTKKSAIDAAQFQAPAGDLMRYFWSGSRIAEGGSAYLVADPAKMSSWKQRLDALGAGLKVGLSWRGGTERSNRNVRSLELGDLKPLLGASGIHWVSLQYDTNETELEAIRTGHGCRLHHWQDAINDYDQTAALVASLDLVISVATSVVHLAGALGQTVWVLVNAAPRWCYMHSGVRLPWYSSAQVFRQTQLGDWEAPIAECAMTLAQFALDASGKSGAK